MVQRFGDELEARDGVAEPRIRPPPLFVGLPPQPPRRLIGREHELAALRAKVCGGGAAALTALNGLPGVGKTALATELVAEPEVRAHFCGGVFWVGLGRTPNIESALGLWAEALDVQLDKERDASERAQALSVALQKRAQGTPVLLVVDDAWSWEDARPFREIDFPGCAHLVTTRNAEIARQFAEDATWVGELTEEQAVALLVERCPKAKDADPAGLRELVRAVGGLPLALTLIATRLSGYAKQTQWVRKEIERLRDAEARLSLDMPLPRSKGETITLRAIVETSVDALGELRGPFAMLGVFAPKPSDFWREAAFAVWGVEEAIGDEWLRQLVERGLLEVAGEKEDRFTLHQVPAAVAVARLGDDCGPRERHARFHCKLVDKDRGDWRRIEQELAQIRHAWRWCSGARGEKALALQLDYAFVLADFFERRRLLRELLVWHERALDAARCLRRRGSEGGLFNNLGKAYSHLGDVARAQDCYQQALVIHREVRDQAFEANTLTNLGSLYRKTGDTKRGMECLELALLLHRGVGHRMGEARVLHNLGAVYFGRLGDSKRALECYEQALLVHREVGDSEGEAGTLLNLGIVYSNLGDSKRALECYEQALPLHRELGVLMDEAKVLHNLGWVYFSSGDKKRALEYYEQALPLYREVGNRMDEAKALNELGSVYFNLGDKKRALECHEQALPLYRGVGNRMGEAKTLHNLGWVYFALGDNKRALEYYEQALPIRREVGNRNGEADTLTELGLVYHALGDQEHARQFHEQALAIAREVGYRSGEGGTLHNLGAVYVALGDENRALEYYEQALLIHRQVGHRAFEAKTLSAIGGIYAVSGNAARSLGYYEQLLPVSRELRDRGGEAAALRMLGALYHDLGDEKNARKYHEQALPLQREVGNQAGEAMTLTNLGDLCSTMGDKTRARELYEQALPLLRELGNRAGEATTLRNLGDLCSAMGDKTRARELYEQALSISRDVGDRDGEVVTLFNLAKLLESEGHTSEAIALLEQVVTIEAAIEHADLESDRAYLEELRAKHRRDGAEPPAPLPTPPISAAAPTAPLSKNPDMTLPKLPNLLLEAYRTDKLALFVGSGLSLGGDVRGGFPTWTQLPERLLQACERYDVSEEAIDAKRRVFKVRMSLDQMLGELGTLKSALGRDYQAALNAIFRPDDASPGAAHRAVVALGVRAILTTNYDQLLEKIVETPARQSYPWTEAAHALGDLKAGRKVLLKVHGTAERHETVVMSQSEYANARADASYQAVLRYLLQDHVFLFVGYGMNDPLDLDLAFKGNVDTFKNAAQRHYLLLRNPTDPDRDRYEREYNVRVIPYAEHTDVPEILARLAAGKAKPA